MCQVSSIEKPTTVGKKNGTSIAHFAQHSSKDSERTLGPQSVKKVKKNARYNDWRYNKEASKVKTLT